MSGPARDHQLRRGGRVRRPGSSGGVRGPASGESAGVRAECRRRRGDRRRRGAWLAIWLCRL